MNIEMHCKISAKRRGGAPQDYYDIHALIDSTKVLCSDARHRVLHTHWGIRHVVVPVFGESITNSSGDEVIVNDLCERDHLLEDFNKKFIPTLGDFVDAIPDQQATGLQARVESIHANLTSENPELSSLLLSPLATTGKLKSLLITHNSWFLNSILPQLSQRSQILNDITISPSDLFNPMQFHGWMDNGLMYPPSAQSLQSKMVGNQQ